MPKTNQIEKCPKHFDHRLDSMSDQRVMDVDYQHTFQKTFHPTNVQDNLKIFRIFDTAAFLDVSACQLIVRGRILVYNEKDGTSRPLTQLEIQKKLTETAEFTPTEVDMDDSEGNRRIVYKRTGILKEVDVVAGTACTPINMLSAALFKVCLSGVVCNTYHYR